MEPTDEMTDEERREYYRSFVRGQPEWVEIAPGTRVCTSNPQLLELSREVLGKPAELGQETEKGQGEETGE